MKFKTKFITFISIVLLYMLTFFYSMVNASPNAINSYDNLSADLNQFISNNITTNKSELMKMKLSKGQIKGGNIVSLIDLMMTLKILSDVENDTVLSDYQKTEFDINGDDFIGLEEAIYLLKKISLYNCDSISEIILSLVHDEKPVEKAKSVPPELSTDINSTVNYLIEGASNEYEIVKVLHDWIALNIAYDTNSYFSGNYVPMDVESVFSRRTAVCSGYSRLFKRFCDIANVECVEITGYSKGYGFQTTGKLGSHAWNGVKIQNQWFLIDTTWNTGYVNYEKEFVFNYSVQYLFTDPRAFIYDHFPYSSKWQLLEPVISEIDFKVLTEINNYVFLLDIQFIDPVLAYPYAYSYTVDNEFEVKFQISDDVYDIGSNITDTDGKVYWYWHGSSNISFQRVDDICVFKINFPDRGEYLFTIFFYNQMYSRTGKVVYKLFSESGS